SSRAGYGGSMTRWIELDGVVNMRDLGGLPTHDGRRTREGSLIRSDNLQDLTDADVRHLVDAVGVSDVIELRSDTERALTAPGPRTQTPLAPHHLSLMPDAPYRARIGSGGRGGAGGAGSDALLLGGEEDRGSPDFWTRHYLGYLDQRPDSV